LEAINNSLCNICRLKLDAPEYGNGKYTVIDMSLPGITTPEDGEKLQKIILGSINSSYIKTAEFDVKISQEMVNQLIMQSANPQRDVNGSTQTRVVPENAILTKYSLGDRLYNKADLTSAVVAVQNPTVSTNVESALTAFFGSTDKKYVDAIRRQQSRSEFNSDIFFIYYRQNPANPGNPIRYFICERDNTFLNYILNLPNKKSTHLNNNLMPSTTLTFTLLGMSGINYLSQFVLDHAPEPYNYKNAVWQIMDVRHNIENKNWTTTIIAQPRPLTTL
jgi:hypothetical protein